MAKQFAGFEPPHLRLIEESHVFFVATAAPDGRVNLSPKGGPSLQVLGPNRLVWRNLTGSGNETAGHLLQANRMTVMWCSFGTRPMILRAYGTARTLHPGDAGWSDLDGRFPPHLGARQVFDMDVEMVQSSCGYAVPFMEFRAERETLDRWTDDKGAGGVRAYWAEKNARTIDGAPTGIAG